jgi:trehalose 6-phosphate phosphatase
VSVSSLPSALDAWPILARQLGRTSFAVFLDYDGTLTPIAARPRDAQISERQRERLRQVAARHRVVVVTGRSLIDIRQMVGLPGLHYAANHGFEISGPDVAFEFDPSLRTTFELVGAELRARTEAIAGVALESKGYSVALHYRLTPPDRVRDVEAAVDDVLARFEGVRKGTGKMVFEIRPAVDWHKGSAVGWLLDRFGVDLPLYVGDDRTDEDALALVRGRGGVGVFVGEPQWVTEATHRLVDPEEVGALLERLARL